jgi:hypothetical protein
MPKKQSYSTPRLESHPAFVALTGISLPIGTTALDNPLEPMDFLSNMDFMETER